jgi:hypothetical protein
MGAGIFFTSTSHRRKKIGMGIKQKRRELAVRRIWESVIATVLGGMILWTMTKTMSEPPAATKTVAVMESPAFGVSAQPKSLSFESPANREDPASSGGTYLSIPAPLPEPLRDAPPPQAIPLSYSAPAGSILLFENFLRYREGEATDWGPNTFIKTGQDGRHWLVSNIEGPHPVGRRMQLPGEFALECRYTTYLPEVTRGLLGWWKDPIASRITLTNDQGAKYTIQWVIQCGSDPTRLNPLGSPTLLARKYFHTFVLPDGSANEIESLQPTGRLRIERNADAVQILLDGRPALAGTIPSLGQLTGFELDVVNARNGMLFFTEFKISR